MFERRWEGFRSVAGFQTAAAPAQLFHCATEALGNVLLKSDSDLMTRTLTEVMATMRTFVIIPVSRGVVQAELMRMDQCAEEAFRMFAAHVRGKADTCGFQTQCTCACGAHFNSAYTDDMVCDVLMTGIADADIRQEALGAPALQDIDINGIITFVERREMARDALPTSALAGISSFKRNATKLEPSHQVTKPMPPPASSRTSVCPECNKPFLPFTSKNMSAHRQCIDCFCMRR